MKKLLGIAAVGLMAMGGSAFGASFGGYNGPIKIKLSNFDIGVLYGSAAIGNGTTIGEAAINALPQIAAAGTIPGEDSWGILRVDQISKNDGTDDVLYSRAIPGSNEITAIFWGERDTYLNITGAGTASEVQEIHGTNMHAAFFEGPQVGPTKYNNGVPGPGARVNSTLVDATNAPSYPTVTDIALIWTLNSIPGFNTNYPADEFFSTYSPSGALLGGLAAQGGMYGKFGAVPGWGLGPENSNFVKYPAGVPDVTVQFTGRLGTNGWLIKSDDPILADVQSIPLPNSFYIGAVGLAGLAYRGYRRMRKAD